MKSSRVGIGIRPKTIVFAVLQRLQNDDVVLGEVQIRDVRALIHLHHRGTVGIAIHEGLKGVGIVVGSTVVSWLSQRQDRQADIAIASVVATRRSGVRAECSPIRLSISTRAIIRTRID